MHDTIVLEPYGISFANRKEATAIELSSKCDLDIEPTWLNLRSAYLFDMCQVVLQF